VGGHGSDVQATSGPAFAPDEAKAETALSGRAEWSLPGNNRPPVGTTSALWPKAPGVPGGSSRGSG